MGGQRELFPQSGLGKGSCESVSSWHWGLVFGISGCFIPHSGFGWSQGAWRALVEEHCPPFSEMATAEEGQCPFHIGGSTNLGGASGGNPPMLERVVPPVQGPMFHTPHAVATAPASFYYIDCMASGPSPIMPPLDILLDANRTNIPYGA